MTKSKFMESHDDLEGRPIHFTFSLKRHVVEKESITEAAFSFTTNIIVKIEVTKFFR